MAYPFYQTYQPQYPQYYPYQQQQYTAAQSGIIWVSGLQEAQMYPLAPNTAVALWGRDGKTVYMKQADATGKPSIKVYDLVERAESASGESSAAEVKLPAYATKDELGAVAVAVKSYDALIEAMRADIDKMSGDLYGLAGKKKSAKKAVDVSDGIE